MEPRTPNSESGFTLAGLIIVLTVMSIFIAYTVPKMWSIATARERDQETLFAMKQYARAIRAFQEKNHTAPVSLDQLKQARNPRLLRGKGELPDPLTGQLDWIVIPAGSAQQAAQAGNGAAAAGQVQTPGVPATGLIVGGGGVPVIPAQQPSVPVNPQQQAGQPGGFVGPIIGVRPNKTGKSYLSLNGVDSYEQWSYTTLDLDAEIQLRRNAMMVK